MAYVLSAFADEISMDLSEQMRVCAEHGIRFIEMRGVDGKNISDVTADEAYEIRRRLDEKGFGVSSLGSPYGKINAEDVFAPHLEKFKRTVEVARILGASRMRVFSFYITPGKNPMNLGYKVIQHLSQMLSAADGLTLCHENEAGIFGENAERCRQLFAAKGGGRQLRFILDPANFVQCGADPMAAFTMLKGSIEYLHVKDAKKGTGEVVPSGRGDGRVRELINALDATLERGETAFLSVEPHLTDFVGLKETGGKAGQRYKDNEEAFQAAVLALKLLLTEEGFLTKRSGDIPVWTK